MCCKKKVKVKDKLCRELPTVVTDVKKAQLQSDLHTAQIKVDELHQEVSSALSQVYTYLYYRYFLALVHVFVWLCLSS